MTTIARPRAARRRPLLSLFLLPLCGLAAALVPATAPAASPAETLLREKCVACHEARPDGSLARIADARRTPEGWDMTLARMTLIHGVRLSADERRTLVGHLADTQGLAPEEAAPWRYILEHRPGATDRIDNELVGGTCARCHSYARVALQRRGEAEWRKLSHFHVGQFPTTELQSGGRDRDWWDFAERDVPPLLARLYPLESAAWKAWQARPKNDPAGSWRIAGHRPGWGSYVGDMTVTRAADAYAVSLELRFDDGRTLKGAGKANFFTGYEWRASLSQGDERVRQVFALSADGNRLSGRWFVEDIEVLGGDFDAARIGGGSAVVAVRPGRLKAGRTQTVTVHGSGLDGELSLGEGVRVTKVLSRSADAVVVEARVAAGARTGLREVAVGKAVLPGALAVYRRIDAIRVEPPHGLARVGGKGGSQPKQPVQYEAVAYAAGKDGKAGTADDVRLGPVAAKWTTANFNPAATAMRDVEFAGGFGEPGLFVPGDAGPNPKRKFGTNNAGEIRVTATVVDGKRTLRASAPLIVTLQRWNNPPIR